MGQSARVEAKAKILRTELSSEHSHVEEPAERYVLDVLRATCSFEDPFALRLFYEALCRVFTVIRVKNKYCEPPSAETGSPSVLLNVGIPTPSGMLIAEVQLILQAYLVAKTVQHRSYEALRAASIFDLLLTPLYKEPWRKEKWPNDLGGSEK